MLYVSVIFLFEMFFIHNIFYWSFLTPERLNALPDYILSAYNMAFPTFQNRSTADLLDGTNGYRVPRRVIHAQTPYGLDQDSIVLK